MQGMPARPTSPPEVGRRALLGAGSLVLVIAAAGCGVRLEEDAPDLPFIPRRAKMPGEDVLLGLLTSTLALAGTATAAGSELGRSLEALHRRQASVVQDALLRGGVPSGVVTAAVAATPTAPTSATDSDLAKAESEALTDPDRYAVLAPEVARPVLALLAQRRAAVALLTPGSSADNDVAATTPPPSPSPTADPSASPSVSSTASSTASPSTSAPASLGSAVTAAIEAIHAFEVIQARSPQDAGPGSVRQRAAGTTTWLRGLAETWTLALGASAPEVPIAITLPFPVTTPDEATKLAAEMLVRLRAALGRHLAALERPDLTAAWATLPPQLADVEVHAHEWGVPLEAFPGLP